MAIKNKTLLLFLVASILLTSCSKGGGTTSDTGTTKTDTFIYKGADVSWLTQMEAAGIKFYNAAGTQTDCMALLQSLGINTIRLRIWVNPTDGWNGLADVLVKARRAKQLGMRILLDFHYSDTWADPGNQTKPAAWQSLDFATLRDTLYNYTAAVLNNLKANGIVPSWVQIGNETNDGMCWPDGKASTNMANFAGLVESGYQAVKSVSDTTKVIVHLSNGYDNSLYRWLFDGLQANGAHWDIIGMSLYPPVNDWQSYDANCLTNMNDMVTRYSKPVMIVEVGMPADQPAVCGSFLADIMSKTKAVSGGKGLGVLYWEPECYNNWQGYGLGAFDDNGRPAASLNAFKN